MMHVRKTLASLLVASVAAGAAVGQTEMTHDTMQHGDMAHAMTGHEMAPSGPVPTEPGQGAFAAIAEIVGMLMADPDTDWSRVDIDSLRLHLVDMDNLVTHAQVKAEPVQDGAMFMISLDGPGGSAASRMVPAHAPVLTAETGWASVAERRGEGIVWTVTSPGEAERIRSLGFFGLMAVGDHHRRHHLGMARGEMMH